MLYIIQKKQPLVYHDGKYWSLQALIKPDTDERKRVRKVAESIRKENKYSINKIKRLQICLRFE